MSKNYIIIILYKLIKDVINLLLNRIKIIKCNKISYYYIKLYDQVYCNIRYDIFYLWYYKQ